MTKLNDKIKEIEKALATNEELVATAPEGEAKAILLGISIGLESALDVLNGKDGSVIPCQIERDVYHERQEECPYYGKYANDPKSSKFLMTAF